jgi:hypothetical protein
MIPARSSFTVSVLLVVGGCASALKPLPPASAKQTEQETPDALYAEVRKVVREVESEKDSGRRQAMSAEAVQLGQRCEQLAPEDARCKYGLALALGTQARERPATARDGLAKMVERLERAASIDPTLDHAGPERVLAIVLARSPGWPTGPGDPEEGLASARRATELDPNYAPNWLAVAEGASVTGDKALERQAARKAASLAQAAKQTGEQDAEKWLAEAKGRLSD